MGSSAFLYFYLFLAWIPGIALGLALFRLKIKAYLIQILLLSFIVSNVCFLLNINDLAHLTSVLQPILILIGYWLLFRISFVYSVIMVFLTYLVNVFLEYAYQILINQVIGLILTDLQALGLLALLGLISNSFICLILIKFRIGFTFLSTNIILKPKFQGNMRRLIYLCSAAFIPLILSGISYIYESNITLVVHVIDLILLGALMRNSFIQEALDN